MTYLIEITNKLTGSSAIYEVGFPFPDNLLRYRIIGLKPWNEWYKWGIWGRDQYNRQNLTYKIIVPDSDDHFLASL